MPWNRFAIEAIVIVGSILLALAADAWWSNLNDREEEVQLLASLKAELEINLEAIAVELVFRDAATEAAVELVEASTSQSALQQDDIDRLLGSLVWWSKTRLSVGALNGLIQGGKLSLIADQSLRNLIASVSREYDDVHKVEDQHFETFKTYLMPYLYENSTVAQLSNAQPTQPGGGTLVMARLPVARVQDHNEILRDQEFIGILTNLIWDHGDVIYYLNLLSATLEATINAIETQISS